MSLSLAQMAFILHIETLDTFQSIAANVLKTEHGSRAAHNVTESQQSVSIKQSLTVGFDSKLTSNYHQIY